MFCGTGIKPIYKKAYDVRARIYFYGYEMVRVKQILNGKKLFTSCNLSNNMQPQEHP